MTGLAPDPAVPRRDALLRPHTMAGILSRRLLGGVPVERCEPLHVKYRFGESLRVAYRFAAGDSEHLVSARTFPPGADEAAYRKAAERPGPLARAPLPAVVHAPEVSAVLWVFPHDRRLVALRRLDDPAALHCARTRVVAYAPERSATAACLSETGEVLAYAKVHRDAGVEARLTRHAARGDVRVPRVLAADDDLLLLQALPGRPVDDLAGLGAALAALHALPRPRVRFERLDPSHLATAAAIVARAYPAAAHAAERLLARLVLTAEDAEREPVCLHGDANLGNALRLPDGGTALIDLEHLSSGPAAADLGQVLARVLVTRRGRAADLLAGYDDPPDQAALRWYTAASVLARVALPAVSRVRPGVLARLPRLLEAAAELVAGVAA
jgi:aminoglycoside phosphotransferase